MAIAWLVTLPSAGLVGAVAAVGVTQGGNLGIAVVSLCALAVAAVIVVLARRNPVTARNVNEAKTVPAGLAVQTGGSTGR
jgi:PiT family inorganic phosphate transporter